VTLHTCPTPEQSREREKGEERERKGGYLALLYICICCFSLDGHQVVVWSATSACCYSTSRGTNLSQGGGGENHSHEVSIYMYIYMYIYIYILYIYIYIYVGIE